MRAAINGVDVVGEREDIFSIGVVVLNREFQSDVVLAGFKVDGRVVQNLFVLVQVFDEFGDASRVLKLVFLVVAFV